MPSTRARAALAFVLCSLPACGDPTSVVVPDAGLTPDDAGPELLDAYAPDAFLTDASVPDAGPPGGCFEGPLRILSSSAGPSERAHVRVLGATAYEHGWLVAATGLHDSTTLLVLDVEGRLVSSTPLSVYGSSVWLVAQDGALYVLAHYTAQRFDVDARGVTRTYPALYVGGSGARREGIRAVEARQDGVLRVLTHFYDEAAGASLLRLSELRRDDASESGLSERTGTLASIGDASPFDARFFLAGDRMRVILPWTFRVLDVRLGALDAAISAEVVSQADWSEAPYAIVSVLHDGVTALIARSDEARALGELQALPPLASASVTLGEGLDLRFGTVGASVLETDDARVLVASYEGIEVFDRESGARAGEPASLEATYNVPLAAMRHEGRVAAAYVEREDHDRHIAIRCTTLSAR